jgi:uncharacterized membrane protein
MKDSFKPFIAVGIVAGSYALVLQDRLREFPNALHGFGFHPDAFARATLATQLHVLAGVAAVILGLVQLQLAKGTSRHRAMGYTWVTAMLTLCASALFVKEGVSLLQILAVVVIGLLARAVWLARRKRATEHAHLMRILVLGATVGVGLFTALPGRVSWALFFSGQA